MFNEEMDVRAIDDTNIFADIKDSEGLVELVSQVTTGQDQCSVEQYMYVNGEMVTA